MHVYVMLPSVGNLMIYFDRSGNLWRLGNQSGLLE